MLYLLEHEEDEIPIKVAKSSVKLPEHAKNSKKFQFFVTHVNGIPSSLNCEVSYDIKGN